MRYAALSAFAVLVTTMPVSAQQVFGAGVFEGILQSSSDNDESFGFMRLVLNKSGTFTMHFNLGVNSVGHHNYVMNGRFDANGAYHFEGPDPHDTRFADARIIDLQLDSVDSPQSINGNVTDLTHSSTIELERVASFSRSSPAPQMGHYTFVFSADNSGMPGGFGNGGISINNLGSALIAGWSPEQRRFMQTVPLTVSGRLPVFAKFAGVTNGILSGWLNLGSGNSGFSDQLTWLGREVPGPNHAFVPEFSGTVSVNGTTYVSPGQNPLFDTSTTSSNIVATFSDGGFDSPLTRTLTMTPRNQFSFTPHLRGDAISFNSKWGTFQGTVMHTDGRLAPFNAVVMQNQNVIEGSFVDHEGETGTLTMSPQ